MQHAATQTAVETLQRTPWNLLIHDLPLQDICSALQHSELVKWCAVLCCNANTRAFHTTQYKLAIASRPLVRQP
eukprot:13261-Heterococcus_DN1.PRE.2